MAKILIVDDEPDTLSLLSITLGRAGYTVLKATDGRTCLDMAAHEGPDLILLDIMMPDMSGLEVIRALQTHGPFPPPVIFFTAKGRMEDVTAGMEAGAYKYLIKPTSREKLLETVQSALAEFAR
jgi:DNA-binding response OmpR family regulator